MSVGPLRRLLARALVDRDYVLARNPDLAAAEIDPIAFFAEYGHREPIRSPSRRAERWIYALSPLIVTMLSLARRDRQDWLDCLRVRINDLSCTSRVGEHRLALRVARFAARRLERDPDRLRALHGGGLGRTLPTVPVADAPGVRVDPVAPAGTFAFHEPRDIDDTRPPTARAIPLPALWCAQVQDASVFGFFQVAAGGRLLVYEPAADPGFRFTARQAEFVVACYARKEGRLLARVPPEADGRIEAAILLGGRCGANYFHFLIEYLTRGYVIERLRHLDGLPLMVSDEMFPQEFAALAIALPGRELIRRPHASRLDVRTLHIPSLMTFLPDSAEVPFWQTAAVNAASLGWLRELVLAHPDVQTAQTPSGKRVYLSRSGGRNIENGAEVEAVFRDHGFSVVDPSAHAFAEQVRMFASASVIAGPMGAAFSNLVFAAPGTHVLVLASPFLTRFPIFATLAAFAGCGYQLIAGEREDFRPGMEDDRQALELTHDDFRVDPAKVRRVLDGLHR